jgi:hypothetical protein
MKKWNGVACITRDQPFTSWIHLEFKILQKINPYNREGDGRLQEAPAELAAVHLDAQLGVTPAGDRGTRRAPETRTRTRKRRVVRDDAERGTRIHQKSAASLLVHKVKKAARGDGAYTPPAA